MAIRTHRFATAIHRYALLGGYFAVLVAACVATAPSCGQEYLSGIEWPKPKIVDPGKTNADPPSDAIVLFDGKDLSKWNNGDNWKVEDGVAYTGQGQIRSKQAFGDCQLHLEWTAPTPASGSGQGRGNSGLFLGPYELQILDSYDNETYYDGQAASIYKQTPPLVNVTLPPGEWNTYDVIWTAPRFNDDGSLKSPAYITALHNGVLVLNHFELLGTTPYHQPPQYKKHPVEMPLGLQDHGNPVGFRNIWIREIKPMVGKRVREAYIRDGDRETPIKLKQ